ncbi:PLP-dependent aminotransferase family protein [Poseidonibacter lekithochrous]|uniref:aminotransferase-like domain-containing protein n=1 Tax=Poseidonibacter lekithochrous TaxID=1904463 RepID=UPI0008FC2FEB|nr:PLP-dependent aminotransferase family protein [Poseidonibacter lekithochrous]QKJ23755.1 PLP-dependent aminotransferase [Poseidonibacter lekithochrous]
MSKGNKRSYIREILDVIDENIISFAGGLPDERLFPLEEIQNASAIVLKNSKALQYSSSRGLFGLRQKIADIYTEKLGFKTSADEILITSGSQQAFDIIVKSLDKKNVIIEQPSYIGAIGAFKSLNMKIDSFKYISELPNKLNSSNILYAISDFQNPSTNSYNSIEREILINIINRKKSFFIEDGAYTFLNFDNEYNTPISKYCERAFHLGSFSKIVAPGLRIGWIRANKKFIDNLLVVKESLDLHTSTLNQMILDEYLTSHDLFSHIKKLNIDYRMKMNFMADCLEKYIPSFKFTRPNGGMFIYGSFNRNSMKLAEEAILKGLAFVPAEVFYLNKKTNEARLNFTNSSFEDIEKGVRILASIIDENDVSKESICLSLFSKYFKAN